MKLSRISIALALAALMSASCRGGHKSPQNGDSAPGAEPTAKTKALETGANVLQSKAPVDQIAMYMNGFHVTKDDPSMVIESDHYCSQVNQDFMQCVLFDGNGKDARLQGVEYVISAKLYATLPPEERMYWHPHNYEILSGELVMPGLPEQTEKTALKDKINSYGKTWELWKSGVHGQQPDPVPYGQPHLGWSANGDGQIPSDLILSRDRRLHTDTSERRNDRSDLAALAKPQGGVDALASHFPNATGAPAGVKDDGDPRARPVPTFGVRNSDRSTGR